ncbi:transmembrane protein 92 [Heterocephalus glaber]|uniref:Transmembrane protein 92 n=1 Tax=Heterocephalus glaber TaxID=10181 RepID=A0AAX6PUJ9_HETGA|nr:transmembrane protein 92 [Heterocephalus glaber]
MSDARVPGLGLPVLLGLLSGLLWASARETSPKCAQFVTCPPGLKCCDDRCCLEDDLFSGPLRAFIICVSIILPILCCCGIVKHYCFNCHHSRLQQGPARHPQEPQNPAHTAPEEEVQATTIEPPPPYNEVVLKPTLSLPPVEPPPPYSLYPEDNAGTQRGIDSPASDLPPPR